jgi:hypothetical protein
MNPKSKYVAQSYESLRQALVWMTAGKVLVHCCPDSLNYFHKNLLTPAEFLNSVEIQTVNFNMTLREETVFTQNSRLDLRFVDLEEFDNFNKKYFRASLLATARDEAPSEELLEKLEFVL